MNIGPISKFVTALALAGALALPAAAHASSDALELDFDRVLGSEPRAPREVPSTVQQFVPLPAAPQIGGGWLENQLASIAGAQQGRIGVAALDLATGRTVSVLGDQPFPMASTSKIAVVATFLEGVDQGRWKLTDQFPLMLPQPSAKFSTSVAPVRAGAMMSAQELIDLCISRSSNPATDALLAVVGGPQAVNRWLRRAGVSGIRMDRDIATLVRDDGEYNPANTIDQRDSATPLAMVELLGGLYEGQWLSPQSRSVLLGAMGRTVTGKRRLRAQLPEGADIAHKTGTLFNTSSDVGIIQTPDGRAIAIAVYATGQGGKPQRDARIATIARVVYDGYQTEASSVRRTASR